MRRAVLFVLAAGTFVEKLLEVCLDVVLDLRAFHDGGDVLAHGLSAAAVVIEVANRPAETLAVDAGEVSYFELVNMLHVGFFHVFVRLR